MFKPRPTAANSWLVVLFFLLFCLCLSLSLSRSFPTYLSSILSERIIFFYFVGNFCRYTEPICTFWFFFFFVQFNQSAEVHTPNRIQYAIRSYTYIGDIFSVFFFYFVFFVCIFILWLTRLEH